MRSRAQEEWKDVPGYEEYYQVSSLGRIRSCNRLARRPVRGNMNLDGRLRKPQPVENGYLQVYLSMGGNRKAFRVHKLVLLAFIGPCPEGMETLHRDGDPTNNRLDNLRYGTKVANEVDRVMHGRTRKKKARLNQELAMAIRTEHGDGATCRSLADRYGTSYRTILRVVNGQTWV